MPEPKVLHINTWFPSVSFRLHWKHSSFSWSSNKKCKYWIDGSLMKMINLRFKNICQAFFIKVFWQKLSRVSQCLEDFRKQTYSVTSKNC